jgi:hypothetical protein
MSHVIRAADGGELLNSNQFHYTKDALGRPVLNVTASGEGNGDFMADGSVEMTGNLQMGGQAILGVKSISNTDSGLAIESEVDLNNHRITSLLDPVEPQDATTKNYVDNHSLFGDDGLVDFDLNMNEHGIINAHRISTDGPAPLYLGATIEPTGTNAPRLTGVTGGGAAFVKANKQSEYATVSVGDPTQNSHAVNMGFLAGEALADQPTQPHQIANKEYVDSCTGKCVQAVDSPNGVLKAYLQNGSRQDVCVVSDSGLSSSIARYTAKAI